MTSTYMSVHHVGVQWTCLWYMLSSVFCYDSDPTSKQYCEELGCTNIVVFINANAKKKFHRYHEIYYSHATCNCILSFIYRCCHMIITQLYRCMSCVEVWCGIIWLCSVCYNKQCTPTLPWLLKHNDIVIIA